ncbi:uncharacterized protein BO95DRAFT_293526 [Aspergillus brunneoviolaceus CBS 621.78]|uniref:Uncharacterized protein n=1 Tax=Aspergillus brunneoviolaceus CBS 621.78 TaxID=1450534 RepID=A0ACD1FUQ7_9EURO|nr:hypothetical protein BO95DRAFT_293526 [Aspergillus brunneoviolaceus CBS 621.78]RAH40731.1 hypothetical protein BO95DRAFT_293526 [Aspergillus brunneoviolaceus CBS 621.78]
MATACSNKGAVRKKVALRASCSSRSSPSRGTSLCIIEPAWFLLMHSSAWLRPLAVSLRLSFEHARGRSKSYD